MNTNTETRIDVLLNRGGSIGRWLRERTAKRLHEPRRAALDFHEAGWIPDDRNPGIIVQPRTDSARLVDVTIWAFMLSIEDGTLSVVNNPTEHNPALEIGACGLCGEEMVFNVPRLGVAGGFVHKSTGDITCHPLNVPRETRDEP